MPVTISSHLTRAAALLGSSAVVAGMVIAAAGPADAQTIACGTTITTSVTLTANLICSGEVSEALTIGAAGLTVNLNGHKILGPGSSAKTYGIYDSGYRGLTVEGGTISDFYDAVLAAGASGNMLTGVGIHNLTITHSTLQPDSWGVYGDYLAAAHISGLHINDAYYGVELDYSQGSTVSYNQVLDPGYGLYDYYGTANTWAHNTVTAMYDYGMEAEGTTSVTITRNVMSGTGGSGIYTDYTTAPSVTRNSLSHLYVGLYDEDSIAGKFNRNHGTGDGWGVYSYEVTGATLTGNSFTGGQYGMETDYPSSEALRHNTTNGNSVAGVDVYTGASTGYSALLSYNTASKNRFGLYSQVPTTGYANTATGNTVVNCYNVRCRAAAMTAQTARHAAPAHRVPALPAAPRHMPARRS